MRIYVDADACPVKEEIYKVARRYSLSVILVSNAALFVPRDELFRMQVVPGGFDAADNWIAEQIEEGDIAITSDIPLAERCLTRGARVLSPKGHPFTDESIGHALASRELMETLRQYGEFTGGPSRFQPADRSRFLGKLDETIQAIRRRKK